MTYHQALQRFGLPTLPIHREEIRYLLTEEIERGRRGEQGEEMLRTLCVQLFSLEAVEDSLLIWDAKECNFDSHCGLDVQFLCGAGLQPTKEFLAVSTLPTAAEALGYLCRCEEGGDFEGFSPPVWISEYRRYYNLDS